MPKDVFYNHPLPPPPEHRGDSGTWGLAAHETFQDGRTLRIVPCLFFYSGFTMGWLYLEDGTCKWLNLQQARETCKSRGLVYWLVDSFALTTPPRPEVV